MKKAIVLSAVFVLISSSSFAAATTYPSKRVCEFKTHGACTEEGGAWVASAAPAAATTSTPAATTAPATTTTSAATVVTPAATPTVAPAAAAPAKSSWFSGLGGSTKTTASAPASAPQKPVDPRQVAKGKVYGSQSDCQSETAGNCVATDCATHVGGVCEGNHGTVWSYAH